MADERREDRPPSDVDPREYGGSYVYDLDPDEPSSLGVVLAVAAVAAVAGVEPIELDPLGSVVDPDALDHLFTWDGAPTDGPCCRVTFEYGGYVVTVDAGRRIFVSE